MNFKFKHMYIKEKKLKTHIQWIIPHKCLFIFCILIHFTFVFNAQSQTNKNFQTPVIWLKADKQGDIPGKWMDVSGNDHHAVLQSNQVFPDSGLFNFQKCFVFDSIAKSLIVDYIAKENTSLRVFAVYKSSYEHPEKGIWSFRLDSAMQVGLTTEKLKSLYKDIRYADSTSTIPIINLVSQNWKNKHIDSTQSKVYVAGTDSLNFTGKFAEFILFDSLLSKIDIYKIHTYLAIKYGVSIKEMDYIDSNDSILWDSKKNISYQYDIAGIGKDTILQLNQKQGAGNGGDSHLIIAAGNLKHTNYENKAPLTHGDFLIWGCNNEYIFNLNPDSLDPEIVPDMSKCIWLMKKTGNTASSISTQLVLKTSGYIGQDTIKLVINRNGDSLFHKISSIIIPPDSIDFQNNYYYSGIHWDNDNSGSDIFSFQIPPSFLINNNNLVINHNGNNNNIIIDQNSNIETGKYGKTVDNTVSIIDYSIFPNPTNRDYYIHLKLSQQSPVYITIQDANGKILKFFNCQGADTYTVKDFINTPGSYIINIETDFEKKSFKQIVTE